MNTKTVLKNILIISAHYHPSEGGTITHTKNLCAELVNLGYTVTLITEDKDGDFSAYDAAKPYRVIRLKTKPRFRTDTYFPILVGRRITRYINELKPDIINISTGNYVPLGLKLSKKQNIPIVYTVHNVPPEESTFNISHNEVINEALKKIYFRIIASLSRFCLKHGRYDTIISGSERTKERLLSAGANSNLISVISYGTVLPKLNFEKKSDTLNIVIIAGIIGHKGQLDAVKAMPQILREKPEAMLYLVGYIREKEYYQQIKKEINNLGIGDSVVLTGVVSSEKLENYYKMCDIYLQPSHQEGFCLAILDALAHGLPAIGTPVGAIPELIGDDRGILIPHADSESIANAVLRFVNDVPFREECGRKARKFVEGKFTWKAVAEATASLYQKTLDTYNMYHSK